LQIVVLSSSPPPVEEAPRTVLAAPENLARASPGQTATPRLPAPFGLEDARALARGLPCALIDVRERQSPGEADGLHVSGPVLPGAALEAFLRQLGAADRPVAAETERLDPGHCAPLAVITDLVRHSREHGALRLTVPEGPVPSGDQMAINAQVIPNGWLYIDLYAADGSVQHLRRGAVPRGTDVTVAAPASGPPGQRLLIAIATAEPLDLAQRPASESDTAYLPAVQRELNRMASSAAESRAEVATLSIIASTHPVASAPRPARTAAGASNAPSLGNSQCRDIRERVQLGETLSYADRTVLRTTCGL
jgi:hypothetical protein